ncbi:MAG: hypothetical protein WA885_04615 [Phormidesmis sp.]
MTSTWLLAIAPNFAQAVPAQPAPILIEIAPAEAPQLEPDATQIPVTCPPGQFASAFSDVYPTDWAYQAVNRLASRSIECFDLPTDLSN